MKTYSSVLVKTLLPLAGFVAFSSPARAELKPSDINAASKLMKAYQAVTGNEMPMPFIRDQSDCNHVHVCSFNFETDRENFGIDVQFKPLPVALSAPALQILPAATVQALSKARVVVGFRTDPNGVSANDDDTFDAVTAEPFTDFSTKVTLDGTQSIAAAIQEHMGDITGVKGSLIADKSLCTTRGPNDSISCALNFQTVQGVQGIQVNGLMGDDEKSLGYIDSLEVKPDGAPVVNAETTETP